MPFADLTTGIRLHYRDGGHGSPILFVPGLAATVDTWNCQVSSLSDRFRCVCVDLRGHGASDKPYSGYSYADMAGDLQALLADLDLSDVTIVGWSMGAGVALTYVLDHNGDGRVTRVVTVGAATPRFLATDTEPYGIDQATADATLEAMRTSLPETMAAFAGVNFHRTDLAATANWFLSMWLAMPAYVGCDYYRTLVTADLRERLPEVDVPVLLCHGRHDAVAHPGWSEYMSTRLKDATMLWFENSGHALMVEEPDALSKAIDEFASGRPVAGAQLFTGTAG